MVGMNAGAAVSGRNSSVLSRVRLALIGGTRAALLTLSAAMALAGGRAADADGAVVCWGRNEYGQCNTPAGLPSVTQIAGGGFHTIALKSDGTVACWGFNYYGQCSTPAGLASVTQIAGGEHHTIALKSNGTVACWGFNALGQCNTPAGLASVTQIAAGTYHTIALKSNGTVACWGENTYGQCSTPAGLASVTQIAAGGQHTITLGAKMMWPVRALAPDQLSYPVFPSIQAATTSPSTYLIEATSAATEPFSAGGRSIHGVSALNIAGDVTLVSNSTLLTEDRLEISGAVNCDATSIYKSNFASLTESGIVFGSVGSPNIRTDAPSRTEVGGVINLALNLNQGSTPDFSCTNSLLLTGSVISLSPTALHTATFNTCTSAAYATRSPCLEFGPTSVIDLPAGNKIICHGPTTTLVNGFATLRNGSSIETDADLAIGGEMRIPVATAVSLSLDRVHAADPALSILSGGELVVEFGSSMQLAVPTTVSIAGDLTVDQDALFSLLGGADTMRVQPNGDVRCFGGSVRADELILAGAAVGSSDVGGRVVGVDALIDVDAVRVQGGSVNLAHSTLVGDLITQAQAGGSETVSTIAASGQVFGNIDNGQGKIISIGDLIVVGDINNQAAGILIAQVGTMYVTGSVINNGQIYGNVITAPSYQGGSGTQLGDGIRIAGSLTVGPNAQLRFVEDLWQLSVCGDVSLACAADNVRFDGATLSLDGCEGSVQSFEASSDDLGCIADAFSGEETRVSLIGALEVQSGATVSLVDAFNNVAGKSAEVVYSRGLRVFPGATLLTNGVKVYTRNALIEGTVDDPANICVVIDTPDPDINGDGVVNGQDLTFVLGFWGTGNPIADLNDDGLVNAFDLSIILSGWTG